MKENEESVFGMRIDDAAREREDQLEKSVNSFIDSVSFGTDSICYKIYSPIHGLNFEEMQSLVKVVDYYFSTGCHPVVYNQRSFVEAIILAKKQGRYVPDTLLSKMAGLNEAEELEIEYRVYVFRKMKQILKSHFDQL